MQDKVHTFEAGTAVLKANHIYFLPWYGVNSEEGRGLSCSFACLNLYILIHSGQLLKTKYTCILNNIYLTYIHVYIYIAKCINNVVSVYWNYMGVLFYFDYLMPINEGYKLVFFQKRNSDWEIFLKWESSQVPLLIHQSLTVLMAFFWFHQGQRMSTTSVPFLSLSSNKSKVKHNYSCQLK